MGECSSRPNYAEVFSHINYRNAVNDAYFHEAYLMTGEKREGLLTGLRKGEKSAIKRAEDYLASLHGQISRAEGRLEKLTTKTSAKLVIEIRKGMDLYPLGFPKVKGVYIRVNFPALEKDIRTGLGDAYIPKWYYLGYIAYDSQAENPEKAILTAYTVSLDGQEKPIAGCEIDLRESIDKTLTRWHLLKLESPYELPSAMPQIEIRYWNLRSLEAFWTNIKVLAMAESEIVEKAFEKRKVE